jgi:hypothetical protein
MRGLEDLEVGKSIEMVNGKPSKRRTIGTKGPGKVKVLAISDHPEDNNALVYKWVKLDEESKRYYEEQKIRDELKKREAQVERQALFLERKEKLAALDEKEKELKEREAKIRELEMKAKKKEDKELEEFNDKA